MNAIDKIQGIIARPDHEFDLAEAALWIAKSEQPSLRVDRYLARVARFAENVTGRLAGRVRGGDLIFALNEYLYDEEGFGGDFVDYHDPRNSLLNLVIDRRKGIPITLSIIYLTVGRCLGLPLEGVAFPGYFVVKLAGGREEVVLDPYEGGAVVHEDDLEAILLQVYGADNVPRLPVREYLGAADKREVVLRMLHNLKTAYMRAKQPDRALRPLEMILTLDPANPKLLRDRGRLFEKLDCHPAAVADYNRYLELSPDASDADKVKARLSSLSRIQVQFH